MSHLHLMPACEVPEESDAIAPSDEAIAAFEDDTHELIDMTGELIDVDMSFRTVYTCAPLPYFERQARSNDAPDDRWAHELEYSIYVWARDAESGILAAAITDRYLGILLPSEDPARFLPIMARRTRRGIWVMKRLHFVPLPLLDAAAHIECAPTRGAYACGWKCGPWRDDPATDAQLSMLYGLDASAAVYAWGDMWARGKVSALIALLNALRIVEGRRHVVAEWIAG